MTTYTQNKQAGFQKRCTHIALACLLIAIASPLVVVADWLAYGAIDVFQRHIGIALSHPPSFTASSLGLTLTVVPALLLSLSLLQARRCFAAFGKGDWFSDIPPKSLAACGRWALAASLCSLALPTLLGPILTMGAPAGERLVSIGISSGPVLSALFGMILWSLGVIWGNARDLASENEQFV